MTTRQRTRRAPARRRRPTVAQRRRDARMMMFLARATIALAGPVCVWAWYFRGASLNTLWIGLGFILVTLASSLIVRRIVIVWISCMGLYAIRWAVCRVVFFPQGPGAIDDPDAPWRVWLGIEE